MSSNEASARSSQRSEPADVQIQFVNIAGRKYAILSHALEESDLPALGAQERAVIEAALAGKSNAQIAAERGTRSRTVANQLASAYRKLGVGSRQQLAALRARSR